jgi:hypothetical protein
MRLAPGETMESTQQAPSVTVNLAEPSLKDLVVGVLDDARELMRAELEIAKADAGRVLRLAALALVVVTATGVLLALALSLALAAVVLALHGTAVEALLSAAAGNTLISALAIGWLRSQLRKAKSKAAADSTTSGPQVLATPTRKEQPS